MGIVVMNAKMIKTLTSTETVDEIWNMIVFTTASFEVYGHVRCRVESHTFLKNITRIKFSIVLLNKMTRFKSIKSFDFIEGIVHFLLTKPYTLTIAVHLKLSLLFISSWSFSLSNSIISFLKTRSWCLVRTTQTNTRGIQDWKENRGTTSRTASSYRRTKVRMG